ncbi:MAG TPA: hypothetical protein VE078_20405, partial [Thermoanaerobaculia bacterium]|nr:hypothetical protein [Thermoanaerobaculia bacterium]
MFGIRLRVCPRQNSTVRLEMPATGQGRARHHNKLSPHAHWPLRLALDRFARLLEDRLGKEKGMKSTVSVRW